MSVPQRQALSRRGSGRDRGRAAADLGGTAMKIAGWSYLSGLRARGRDTVLQFLTRDVVAGPPGCSNNMARLYRHLRRGDVVLAQDHTQLTPSTKYTTHPPRSHTP